MSNKDFLDEAIDRAVREMTHVATDDRDETVAVARVMARLREADVRRADARGGGMFAPRLAWAGAAVVVVIAIVVTGYSLRSPAPDTRVTRVAERATTPSASPTPTPSTSASPATSASASPSASASAQTQQTPTSREIPTRAADAASTVRATTVARDARDAQPVTPLESDIEIASITPAPLAEAPAIYVEPLITSSLHVDEIPVESIEMPPVSPERNE